MEKLTCVAVDDEAPALRIIEAFVNKTEELRLSAKFRNPVEAAEWLKQNSCKILFLDIQMPQQNGMDFYASLPDKPVVIFTTAYSEFAADAFDIDAADYLRKPFSFERFLKAVEKAKDCLQLSSASLSELEHNNTENFISVKADGRLSKIFFSDILYIEAFQEYIKIFTARQRYITYQRLKNMETILPPAQFMRVHRSYIVALSQVRSISGNMIEIAGQQIPVSRDMKEALVAKVF